MGLRMRPDSELSVSWMGSLLAHNFDVLVQSIVAGVTHTDCTERNKTSKSRNIHTCDHFLYQFDSLVEWILLLDIIWTLDHLID